jgi:hypothetical protein
MSLIASYLAAHFALIKELHPPWLEGAAILLENSGPQLAYQVQP